ncbi:hypothetical protein EAO73_09050 [Streptomyces sp. col6]|nr:hypothetical protein EAO73_09050 [Streptomyces sp. col6]
MASEPASARAEPGAVVSIEHPLNVIVSAVTRATANPVPIDFLLLGTACHSLVCMGALVCDLERRLYL